MSCQVKRPGWKKPREIRDLAANSIVGYASFLTGMAGYLVGCEAEITIRAH
jgi:hypothetical protein